MKKCKLFLPLLAVFAVLTLIGFAAYGRLFGPISVLADWGSTEPGALTIRYVDGSSNNQYTDITALEVLSPLVEALRNTDGFYFMHSGAVPVGYQLTFHALEDNGTAGRSFHAIELPGDGFIYIEGRAFRISDQRQDQIIAMIQSII